MAFRVAKQLLRKDVKLRISDLSEEEKLRQSKVVTDKVIILLNIIEDLAKVMPISYHADLHAHTSFCRCLICKCRLYFTHILYYSKLTTGPETKAMTT